MSHFWPIAVAFAVVSATASAQTGTSAEQDKPLVDACAHELADRQKAGGQDHAYTISASETERPNETTVRVRLSITSGEGRLIQGTCVFRNGKLFDVRQ